MWKNFQFQQSILKFLKKPRGLSLPRITLLAINIVYKNWFPPYVCMFIHIAHTLLGLLISKTQETYFLFEKLQLWVYLYTKLGLFEMSMWSDHIKKISLRPHPFFFRLNSKNKISSHHGRKGDKIKMYPLASSSQSP